MGYSDVRLLPDDHGKADHSFLSLWSRLGHRQTLPGRQPIEHAAYGAFLISVGGDRPARRRVPPPPSTTMTAVEIRIAVILRLKGPNNTDSHHIHSAASTAIWRSCAQINIGWNPRVTGSTRQAVGFIGRARTAFAAAKQLQPDGAGSPLGCEPLAYQLGDCFIIKVKSVSNAGAQRVEFPARLSTT